MYVIERGGVTWAERFYAGRNFSNLPLWGSLDEAVKFSDKTRAVKMSYRIDDEEGCSTRVEEFEIF